MAKGSLSGGKTLMFGTTFVMFFLSLDIGQHIIEKSFDLAFSGLTVVALVLLPYFLRSRGGIGISAWIARRSAIVVLGLVAGVAYSQIVGVVVPEFMAYLPLALATIAGFVACCVMYANLFDFTYAD